MPSQAPLSERSVHDKHMLNRGRNAATLSRETRNAIRNHVAGDATCGNDLSGTVSNAIVVGVQDRPVLTTIGHIHFPWYSGDTLPTVVMGANDVNAIRTALYAYSNVANSGTIVGEHLGGADGVRGITDVGNGVRGVANGSNGTGVLGTSSTGQGVSGTSVTGTGVIATATGNGFALVVQRSVTATTKNVATIEQLATDANGVALRVNQAGGNSGLFVNGTLTTNAQPLVRVDSASNSAESVQINHNGTTVATPALHVAVSSATASARSVSAINAGSGAGVYAENNGTGYGLHAAQIAASGTAAAGYFTVTQSGSMAEMYRDVATTSAPGLKITLDNATDGGRGIDVRNDGTNRAIYAENTNAGNIQPAIYGDSSGEGPGVTGKGSANNNGVDALAAGAGAALNAVTTGTGRSAWIHRHVSGATVPVAHIQQTHTSNGQAALRVEQSGTGDAVQIVGPMNYSNSPTAGWVLGDDGGGTGDIVYIDPSTLGGGGGLTFAYAAGYAGASTMFALTQSGSGNCGAFTTTGAGSAVTATSSGTAATTVAVTNSGGTSSVGVDAYNSGTGFAGVFEADDPDEAAVKIIGHGVSGVGLLVDTDDNATAARLVSSGTTNTSAALDVESTSSDDLNKAARFYINSGTTNGNVAVEIENDSSHTDSLCLDAGGRIRAYQLYSAQNDIDGSPIAPTFTAQAGAGGGATTIGSAGNNMAGKIVLTTGAIGLAAGSQVSVTFATGTGLGYTNAPTAILLTAISATAAPINVYIPAATNAAFAVFTTAALAALTTYEWYYQVIG